MTKQNFLYHAGLFARWTSVALVIVCIGLSAYIARHMLKTNTPSDTVGILVLYLCLLFLPGNFIMFLGRNSRDIRPLSRRITRGLSRFFGLLAPAQAVVVLLCLFVLPLLFQSWKPGDKTSDLVTLMLDFILTGMIDVYANQLWSWSVLKKI